MVGGLLLVWETANLALGAPGRPGGGLLDSADALFSLGTGVTLVLALAGARALMGCYTLLVLSALASGFYALPVVTVGLAMGFSALYLSRTPLVVFSCTLLATTVLTAALRPDHLDVLPLMLVPALAGTAVGLFLRRESVSLERARRRNLELVEARDRAMADIRRSLARDLHDVVAQDLAVLAMQTQAIRVAPDRAAQQRMADAVADVARQAHANLRGLLQVLYAGTDVDARRGTGMPDALDTALVTSSAQAARDAAARLRTHGFDVDLQVQEQDGLRAPRHVDATVHRIAHEAVTNVVKHAPAGGACQVLFTLSPGQVRLRVLSELSPAQHPGRPRDAPQPDGSFGVLNIRERAGLLGGRADVGPREGRWHVDVRIPFGVPA